jgi:hypothetical protein
MEKKERKCNTVKLGIWKSFVAYCINGEEFLIGK